MSSGPHWTRPAVGKPCSPSSSSAVHDVDLLHAPAGRQDVARGEGLQPGHADARRVEAGAVLEPARRPHPPDVPPVAHAPAVVALADAVERDRLVADEDLAVDVARHLVAGGADPRVEPAPVGLPLEVEAERHPIASQVAVDLGRVVDGDRERLAPQRHVLERRLDDVVGPEPVGADLQRRRLRERAPRGR